MRASFESRLSEIWYRREIPPWYLRVLTPVYQWLASIDRRRHLRNRAVDLEGKCIIVVGNLTAGGTGKTPLILRLCDLFRDAGMRPGVISRGYGRKDKQQHQVAITADPEIVGDEPLLIAQRSGVPVVVGRSRIESARSLFDQGVNVVLSDDGLQHLSLPRAVEICVVDGERGFGNGYLLPAGPLREDPRRLGTVNHVVVNGGSSDALVSDHFNDKIEVIRMDVHAKKVCSLSENLNWRLSQFSGCRVSAVAGISNPDRFFNLLRQARIEVEEHIFPDHHQFREEDFSELSDDLPVIMTEKDAVKCMRMKLENTWYLSVDAQLPSEWEAALLRNVSKIINEN